MRVELTAALRLLSHELRTPTGVIQGYSKMLLEDRVADDMRQAVLGQMQRAVARISLIAQQSHDLMHWISDIEGLTFRETPIQQVLEEARKKIGGSAETVIQIDPACIGSEVLTPDASALPDVLSALAACAARLGHGRMVLAARPSPDVADAIDISAALASAGTADRPDAPQDTAAREPLDIHAPGQGLALLLASTIADAHGGWSWQQPDRRTFGLTLPTVARNEGES